MNVPLPDELVIQASGFGRPMTARQSIQHAEKLLLDLEAISPWRRPFEVSGSTEETGDMPIAADLSDFDEVVMRALKSRADVKYYNENDQNNWSLTPDSFCPYGFGEIFTNAPSVSEYKYCVSIGIRDSGLADNVFHNNAVYYIGIPFCTRDKINSDWTDPAVVFRLFEYLIGSYDPKKCVAYGNSQTRRVYGLRKGYLLGWLNYTRDPKIAGIFMKTGKAVPYRAGVLLKLGDDVSVLSDPSIDTELTEIGDMLASAGVTH